MLNYDEKQIIGDFLKNLDANEQKTMTLKWNNGRIIDARFDTCFEDANDFDLDESDENFEEYISFVFKAIKICGTPPVEINKNGFFLINYHNFPDEIIVDGQKIN